MENSLHFNEHDFELFKLDGQELLYVFRCCKRESLPLIFNLCNSSFNVNYIQNSFISETSYGRIEASGREIKFTCEV